MTLTMTSAGWAHAVCHHCRTPLSYSPDVWDVAQGYRVTRQANGTYAVTRVGHPGVKGCRPRCHGCATHEASLKTSATQGRAHKPADRQKSRLYAAECTADRRAAQEVGMPLLDTYLAQQIADAVVRDAVAGLGLHKDLRVTVTVQRSRSMRVLGGVRFPRSLTPTITVGDGLLTTLLHELAHIVQDHLYERDESYNQSHGPEFAGVALALYTAYGPDGHGQRVAAEYVARKVKADMAVFDRVVGALVGVFEAAAS